MPFCLANKKILYIFFSFIATFFLWSDIYIQELPSGLIPPDFPAGWYESESGYFFINPDAGIYISTFKPVQEFTFVQDKLSPAGLPPTFSPVEIIPQMIEGHALSADLSYVESFDGVEPIFPGKMGLLTVTLYPGHDHFQNHCNIINVPLLKSHERLIYFIYSFAPTNLKIAPGGRVNEIFSYLINDTWITSGNIHTTNQWILGTLMPKWFDKNEALQDLYFMINDHPPEYTQTTHYFLIDGLFILSEDALITDLLAPSVDIVGKTFQEKILVLDRKFYLLLTIFIAASIIFSIFMGRYLFSQRKELP